MGRTCLVQGSSRPDAFSTPIQSAGSFERDTGLSCRFAVRNSAGFRCPTHAR